MSSLSLSYLHSRKKFWPLLISQDIPMVSLWEFIPKNYIQRDQDTWGNQHPRWLVCLSQRGRNSLNWRWAWAMNFTSRFKCSSWEFSFEDFSSSQYTRENWLILDFVINVSNRKIKYNHVKKAHKIFPPKPNNTNKIKQSNKNNPPNTKTFEEKKNITMFCLYCF